MKPQLFLGVDGGGTGCRARIVDEDGRTCGTGSSGPATLRLGAKAAMASVTAAALAALADAGLPATDAGRLVAGLALAGLGRAGAKDALLAERHPFASVHPINDAWGALLGAHAGRDGAIVSVGTGSVGLGTVGGHELRVGGYGFPISDEGSGAWMGLQALQLALKAHDGRHTMTALTAEIMGHFENDPYRMVAWMDGASASDYATFARPVVAHAEAGDENGNSILDEAASHIDQMLLSLSAQGAPALCLLGGLAPVLQPRLRSASAALLRAPMGDAVDGAIIFARRSTGFSAVPEARV